MNQNKILKKLRIGAKTIAFLAGLAFAVVCFVALNAAMKPVSKSEYCGSNCHEMNSAYRTWELSTHGTNRYGFRVECIDCHLSPKEDYFTHIVAKAYAGAKDTYKHHFGKEYNQDEIRMKVLDHLPNERCMYCHDNLLAMPGSSSARIAHTAVLDSPDDPESRCVSCHEDAGHQRQEKIFSP
jgi:nitrate/TMAO reductase-like tetraheme cytochrome c subunit